MVQIRADGTLKSPLKKLLSASVTDELLQTAAAEPGDLLLMAAGSCRAVVRLALVRRGSTVGNIDRVIENSQIKTT